MVRRVGGGDLVPNPSFHRGPHKPTTTETVFDSIGVISLGSTGEIYESTARTIAALALPPSTVSTAITSLHRSSIEFFAKLLAIRRALDAAAQGVG